jgi:hypothetical protein
MTAYLNGTRELPRTFLRVGNIPALHGGGRTPLPKCAISDRDEKRAQTLHVPRVNRTLQGNYHNCLNYEGVYHVLCVFSKISPNNINSGISNNSFDVLE